MNPLGFVRELVEATGRQMARKGINSAQELAEQIMPVAIQTGDPVLVDTITGGLRNLGAKVPSLPGPGLLGIPNTPPARQLRQAPVPAFGPGAARQAPTTGGAPGVRGVSPLAQNRPPAPLPEAPTPPVRYPEPARGETARQITMLKPGEGEVGSMGTRLTYRPGVEGVSGRLGSTTYGQGTEIGAPSAYPRMYVGPSAQDQMRLSSQLNRGPSTAEMPGTPLFGTRGGNQYVAPRPAFGPGATGEALDGIVDLAFGGSRGGGGALGRVVQDGPGGALVRSAAGEVVDELMIDPVYVREIMDKIPELRGISNAAGGVQTGDLGAIMSNPALRALLGAGGLTALAFGVGSMDAPDRTGETTAGTPPPRLPELVPGVPLIRDNDGSVPGVAPGSPLSGGAPGSALANGATTGGDQINSSLREAVAQGSPAAAAVLRATEPMSPERYSNIADYYAAREAFARSEGPRRELMKYMEGQSSTIGSELSAWAQANPGLAYEYQRRQLANPMANQQSAEVGQGIAPSTAMGTETDANAIGAAEANAQAGVNPTQGANDIANTLQMQVNSTLERIPAYAQRMNWRQRAASGYPGLAAGAPIQYNN
jgi:hypothetical protein